MPVGFDLGGELGHQHAGGGAVFVADVLADQKAVRFFRAEEELVGTAGVDLLGDPLEADVDVVVGLDAVAVADAADHRRGDERRDEEMFLRQRAGFFALLADVVGEQGAELIAGEGAPGAFAVLW